MRGFQKSFILLTLLIAISCGKEAQVEPQEQSPPYQVSNTTDSEEFSMLNLSEASYTNHYFSNPNKERGGGDPNDFIPTYEMLNEIEALILADDVAQPFLDNFLENHGSFEWNYSFMKKQDDLCFISIPMLKNGQLSGVLKFYKKGDETAIRFVSKSVTDEIVSTHEFSGDLDLLKGAIIDLIVFEMNIHQTINTDYFEWLERNRLTNDGSSRGDYWCIWETEYSYVFSGTIVESDGFITYIYSLQTIYNYECFYQTNVGAFPNDYNPTTGNGGGNGNTNTDNTNTEEPPTPQESCLDELGVAVQGFINELQNSSLISDCQINIDDIINTALINLVETGQCQKLGGLQAFKNEILNALQNNDCVLNKLALAENGILVSRTCKSSFDFTQVGTAWTCQVNNVFHAYQPSFFNIMQYTIPELCVQVSGTDANGQALTAAKAAELSAFAMDNARLALLAKMTEGLVNSDLEAKTEFKDLFAEQLTELTIGNTSSSISYGQCFGNINTQNYALSPFGGEAICISF